MIIKIGIAVLLVGAWCFVLACLRSPEGYQDETGFHYGKHPKD
jgi:hypothetical protein